MVKKPTQTLENGITAGNIVIKGKKTSPIPPKPETPKNINKGKPISQFMRDMMKTGDI